MTTPTPIEPDGTPPALWRRPDEAEGQHRTFLLWLVLRTQGVSRRAFADALGCNESTLRQTARRKLWEDRAGEVEDVEVQAAALLRAMYPGAFNGPVARLVLTAMPPGLDLVDVDLDAPDARGDARISPRDDAPAPRPAATDEPVARPEPDAHRAPPTPAPLPQSAPQPAPEDRLVRVLDAAIGIVVRKMQPGPNGEPPEVRASLADLPPLIKTRALLTGGATSRPDVQAAGTAAPPETVRLRQARRTGDEAAVLRALREDALEVVAIADALLGADAAPRVVPLRAAEEG